MATELALDTSPASALAGLRGVIVAARFAHPDVVQVTVRDAEGHNWRLASQDASVSPEDPKRLAGLSVEEARIDPRKMSLRCQLSNGSALEFPPAAESAAAGDPPYWELLTPRGQVLQFGPGAHWEINE